MDYKSSSDEEDNDSSDDEESNKRGLFKKEPKPPEKDVVMELIKSNKTLIRRELEARLARIKKLQANLSKWREKVKIEATELTKFDEDECYDWYKGLDEKRNVYFAMGTKFGSSYKKGDQLFNSYGRRNSRFLLLNYGFTIRNNKYNSLGFKVFVHSDDGNQHQKIIRLKLGRLSLDFLSYLRANLINSHTFTEGVKENICVGMPCDIGFELYIV